MSRRRFDPRQHEFDGALRSALHMAVDSLQPGADGLDQIRTKIAAQPSARRKLTWLAATTAGGNRSGWHVSLPRSWFPAIVGPVVERFKPDPNRAGWFGWLRPAAAVTTGLFVITAASWAVAALPSAIDSSGSRTITSSRSTSPHHPHKSTAGYPYSSGNSGGSTGPESGRSGGTHPHTTPSCTTPGGAPSGSPTGTATGSASPTVSGSTSTSPSTSPSTSVSSGSPPQTSSPTVGGPASAGATSPTPAAARAPSRSPEATVKALLTVDGLGADLLAGLGPVVPTETPPPTASPTVSGPASSSQTGSPPPSTPCAGA